ncbi:MAG: O-antigen ligase family protein [Eubacterium sp.]|nr:O-antigen ligase family protein [Eubacterium sp.]
MASPSASKWYLLAQVLIFGVIPLLLGAHIYTTGLTGYEWFPDTADNEYDYYLHAKMMGVYITTALILCTLLYRRFVIREKLDRNKTFFLLAGAGVLVILSGLFGGHMYRAFVGSYDMFTPVFVVVGYLIICYYAFVTIKTEEQIEWLAKVAGVLIGIMMVIGVFQAFGLDFFQCKLGIRFLVGIFHQELADAVSNNPQFMNLTLSHADNVSGYLALITPLTIAMMYFFKKTYQRVIAGVFLVAQVIIAIGIKTASIKLAFVMCAGVVFLILISRKPKVFIGVLAAGIVCFIAGVVVIANSDTLKTKLYNTFVYPLNSENASIERLYTGDDEFIFYMKDGSELHYSYGVENGTALVYLTDEDGNPVSHTAGSDGEVVINDSRFCYGTVVVSSTEEYGIVCTFTIEDRSWNVVYGEDGTYYYLNFANKLVKINEDTAFEKLDLFPEGFFTTRGAIWNRVIPLLKYHLILGVGANSFVEAFPQADYVEDNYDQLNLTFDVKAHNYFLNTSLEQGVLATCLVWAFFIIYLVQSIRLYRKMPFARLKEDRLAMVGMACMVSVIWFLINSVANDSYVGTAPIFWTILGMGYSLNHIVGRKDEVVG